MRGQAVHEQGMRRRVLHESGVDLIRRKHARARVGFGFFSHAGPDVGVNSVGSGYGFAGVGVDVDGGSGFFGQSFGGFDNRFQRGMAGGRGDRNGRSQGRPGQQQRVRHVIAVADIREMNF